MRLKDRIAIITGVGAGIGEAIAIRFAEEGAQLVLADIQEPAGRATLDKVTAMGANAAFVQADISQEESAGRIAEFAVASFGGIDILVNNAADFTQMGVERAEVADWQRVLGVNVIGPALVTRFAIPFMKAKGGSIVNMASMSGLIARFREVHLTLERVTPVPDRLPKGWLQVRAMGNVLTFVDSRFAEDGLGERIQSLFAGVLRIDAQPMGLRSIFTALARAARDGAI